MRFAWFDAKGSKEFGATLAQIFVQYLPIESGLSEKAFTEKVTKALSKAAVHIAVFKRENKLNIYKKAQIGNSFKWTLREAGLDPDYIDQLTKWLMLEIS